MHDSTTPAPSSHPEESRQADEVRWVTVERYLDGMDGRLDFDLARRIECRHGMRTDAVVTRAIAIGLAAMAIMDSPVEPMTVGYTPAE